MRVGTGSAKRPRGAASRGHHGRMNKQQQMTAVERSFITPSALGRDYRRVCRLAGLHPSREGYGAIHAQDAEGYRYTLFTSDVEYVRTLAEARSEDLAGLVIPPGRFPRYREGWPDEWLK